MSQTANLDRVKSNIGVHVQAFVQLRWDANQKRFAMRELHDYIFQQTQIAPASPDRVLRQLRLDGEFDYRVVNRKESLYEITAVGTSTRATNWVKPGPIVIVKGKTVTVNHLSPTHRLLQTLTAVRKQGSNADTLTTFSKSLDIQPGDSLEIIDL